MQPQFGFFTRYSTMTSRSLLPLASRSIHQRGYNNFDDHVSMIFNEINFALINAKNTPNIVFIYDKFGEKYMTPEQIMFGFQFICNNGLEKSPDFWNKIVPLVKK